MIDQTAATKIEKASAGILAAFAASAVSNGNQKKYFNDGLSLPTYIFPITMNSPENRAIQMPKLLRPPRAGFLVK